MKKTDTINKSELNVMAMENVSGGTGPLTKTGPLASCDPPMKETGPLGTGPLGTCDPPKGTGPLNYPYKETGPLNYPYKETGPLGYETGPLN